MRLHNTQTFNILSKAVFCAAKGGLFMMKSSILYIKNLVDTDISHTKNLVEGGIMAISM